MGNDTIIKTLIVAGLLSIICSVIVSSAAVFLKSNQMINKDLDRKKNILMAAGLLEEGKSIEELFEKFEIRIVDLSTGVYSDDLDATTFDQRKAAKSEEYGITIEKELDWGGNKRRSKYALVYIASDEKGKLQQLILPVHGKGLWSTLYGFLALDADMTTINGFAFYEHGETPGLGGEVDNPLWKAQWIGKKAFDESWKTRIEVLKGKVNPNSPNILYQVDGLSGATITSRGVRDLLRYWLGEDGFGPFLNNIRTLEGINHG
jgi:Na+-transporting NADH:ubiquinone oxidoreductase subunit C